MKSFGMKRLAGRYVKALFEVAEPAHALDTVDKDLSALGRVLDESGEFRHFLANPLLSRGEQEEAMESVLDKIKAADITRKFIAMLARQKRLPALPEIIRLFAEAVMASRGEMQAEVVSSEPLDKKDAAAVGERLGRAYGKKVRLNVAEDAALLGGIVIKIGSIQLDGSLAGKLDRLAQKLKAA